MLCVTGTSERQPWASNVAPHGAALESTIFLPAAMKSSQVAGAASATPAFAVRPECHPVPITSSRNAPAIELAVDRVLGADRRNDVVNNIFRDVLFPRLDHVALDHRRHFDERRLADGDVPGTLLFLGLGDEALDAKTLHRRDLVVDPRELGVHFRNGRMKVLDPLIER